MKKMTLVHPYKVRKVMREFLDTASDLEYCYCYWTGESLVKENGEIDFDKFNRGKRKCIVEKAVEDNFYAWLGCEKENFVIGYNFDALMKHDSGFREDINERSPLTKGFADITLALLHELGHFETEHKISKDFNKEVELEKGLNALTDFLVEKYGFEGKEDIALHCLFNQKFENMVTKLVNQTIYFKLENERLATDWAIKWLENPENRKIAKKFEKAFFACFE